jgi:uncharacterized membrane protein
MAAITETIEIARPPEEVFAYVDDLSRHGEWQESIQSTKVETDGPTRVGTRASDVRKTPGGEREIAYEVTEHDPPRRSAFRGVSGPVRPVGGIRLEPSGAGTRYTLELDFEGHGLGILLKPLVMRSARKQVPGDLRRLKERLESGAAGTGGAAQPEG